MRLLALFVLALSALSVLAAQEFDAVVVGVSGAATLRGSDELSVYNCKLPTQAPPRIEFDIARPAQCGEAFVVNYERYDFDRRQFVPGGQLCIVPPAANCKATVPIKLGGSGRGEIELKLLRLTATCQGIEYAREFTFRIIHQPDPVEQGVMASMAEANATAERARAVLAECGQCCAGAGEGELAAVSSALARAATALTACDMADATSQAGLAAQSAQAALALAEARLADCRASGGITITTPNVTENVTENVSCANTCLPDEEQLPDCSCIKKPISIVAGNITGNATVANATTPPARPRPCGLFALLLLACLAVLRG
ncbi:MAG: hypothetical protein QXG98_01190 [Candidatus Micrarchaeia archaeon]